MGNMVLEGVRVADWTIVHAGPKGTVWLAALGAEVIHVERAGVGDTARRGGASPGTSTTGVPIRRGDDRSILFEIANFNKKSMTVDLSKEQGKEIIYRLVEKSDVFATNQLPDTIEKLGMDYDTLAKYNPQLIYVTNSIVGYKGPYRVTPGADSLGQAVSGVMTTSGLRGEPPTPGPWGVGDLTSAFAMFSGVITALLYRQRTGKGQRVDTSQMQSLMNIPVSALLAVYSTLSEEERRTNPYGGVIRADPRDSVLSPAAHYYQCKGGRWIHIAANSDKYFTNLARALGHPELLDDPRFADGEKRVKSHKELIKILDETFAKHTVEEWREKFEGLDVPFYQVNDLPDLLEDPQVLANDMLWTFEHPHLGTLKLPGMPFNLSESPGMMLSPAPELGEHTEEVLLELGYSWDEIARFHTEGVV